MKEEKSFGVNVWWTIPSTIVDGEMVHSLLEKHGFEKSMIPMPTRRTQVSRAVKSYQNLRSSDGRRIAEKVKDTESSIVFGILDRESKSSEEVAFEQQTTIRLDKATGNIIVSGDLSDQVRNTIKEFNGKMDSSDIQAFLRRVVTESWGVSKRPTGGIYFIPSYKADMISKAQAFLNDLDCGAKVYIEGLINGTQERQNVWKSVEDEMRSSVDQALSAARRIEKSVKCLTNQKSRVARMEEMMDIYTELLGSEATFEEMQSEIRNALGEINTKMGSLTTVAEAKAEAKKAKAKSKSKAKKVKDVETETTEAGALAESSKTFYKTLEVSAIESAIINKDGNEDFNNIVKAVCDDSDSDTIGVNQIIHEALEFGLLRDEDESAFRVHVEGLVG